MARFKSVLDFFDGVSNHNIDVKLIYVVLKTPVILPLRAACCFPRCSCSASGGR